MKNLEEASVFQRAATQVLSDGASSIPVNLIAYNGIGRLFIWNTAEKLLHFVEVKDAEEHPAGGLSEKTMKLNMDIDFQVRALKFNRTGSSLLLVGDKAMVVVDVASSTTCRAGIVGGDIFNGRSLRVLSVAWHPYSDVHVGVLSSDGVFRLFSLISDPTGPEQEFHLQVGLGARSSIDAYSRPISFAFGGEHFWDRFTVFILFSDASIYALCPIVPFGSLYSVTCLKDLAKDASQMVSRSSSMNLASVWLEIVFPELSDPKIDVGGTIRSRPQVPFEASLVLQGPFSKVLGTEEKLASRATSLLYSSAGKDSIFTVTTKTGELLFYALADEVHPMWDMHNVPRLILDEAGDLLSVGMLVEPSSQAEELVQESSDSSTPPMLHLASVDLALQAADACNAGPLGIFSDPLAPERFYCYHPLGLDTVQLQWLPFSDGPSGKGPQAPLVFPVLDTLPQGDSAPTPLLGATVILDRLGATWLVAVTASGKCAVIEVKPQRALPPLLINDADSEQEKKANDAGDIRLLCADLLAGPKDISIPQLSPSTPLTLQSVEGRSALHDQCKLLHEKYIEYAHRAHFELKTHQKHLTQTMRELVRRAAQAANKVKQAEDNSTSLVERIHCALEKNMELQERVRECNKLPGLRQRILTAAERDFKSLLDTKVQQDVDILQAAVESLSLRGEQVAKKRSREAPVNYRNSPRVPSSQMRAIKLALDKTAQYIDLCKRRADVVEQAVRRKETMVD